MMLPISEGPISKQLRRYWLEPICNAEIMTSLNHCFKISLIQANSMVGNRFLTLKTFVRKWNSMKNPFSKLHSRLISEEQAGMDLVKALKPNLPSEGKSTVQQHGETSYPLYPCWMNMRTATLDTLIHC